MLAEINETIRRGQAVVVTAEEIASIAEEKGVEGRPGDRFWEGCPYRFIVRLV